MVALFRFEVHTLYRLFFSGKIESVTLALTDGEIGVLASHSFFTAPVLSCIMCLKDDKGVLRSAFVTDGILEVKEHKTVLMVDAAEWLEEIDADRALAAKEKAEADLLNVQSHFEAESARTRLRRAEYRLKAYALKTQAKA